MARGSAISHSSTATQVPRSPAFRNRLYGTVLNDNRKTQETAGLGADVAGVVAFDVKVLNIRPPR